MSIRRMDKEDMVHVYNGILLNCKKNEITSFAATWVGLEIIVLGEINQKERNISYYTTLYMKTKKKKKKIQMN